MDSLISTEELAAEPAAQIVDATYFTADAGRDARAEFEAAHIPGARFLDLGAFKDATAALPMMLPDAEQAAAHLAQVGLDPERPIVLYGNSPHRTAARAWWMLTGFGARAVRVLDGGFTKWRAEGRPVESGAPARISTQPGPRAFNYPVRTLDDLRANLATRAEQLLDARPPARFSGAEPDIRPGMPSGHIPGSRNLPHANLFNPDGTWKRGDALRAAFEQAGIDLDAPITVTCGSGITAAVLAFGLHLLGREAALYDGSWAEWGADPSTPKATA